MHVCLPLLGLCSQTVTGALLLDLRPRNPLVVSYSKFLVTLLVSETTTLTAAGQQIKAAHTTLTDVGYVPVLVGCVAQLSERRSLDGELTVSCARTAADG